MDGGQDVQGYGPLEPVTDGAWAGWSLWGTDPFEALAGPFYCRFDEGRARCAFRAEPHHLNGGVFMHGGALMTFADYCLFVIARDALADAPAVTTAFNAEFVGAVSAGALVEGSGEVVKAGRTMIFVRGLMSVGGDPVLSFSGVLKKVGPRGG